mmetsp:Transcript_6110/g.13845  ORF Transcript_6110/g.13845 Transcript_6110/m.13845 type:complete len:175 (+) Transcript_6110:1329-1853(+)
MAEHGGFEQTNGRALDTIGKFGLIAKVCVAAYPSTHPIHSKVKEDFALYEDVAAKLHSLALLMKSQKKIDSDQFDNTLLDFILAWDETFPGRTYFNKLHFVMMHLPDFVEEFGICGRASYLPGPLEICGGGRINSKYKDQFMFVKTGRAPDSWVEGFADTQLLSLFHYLYCCMI